MHGEVRNGGFPDWLLEETNDIRTNNPTYQSYVQKFFTNIYSMVKGLFDKEGGPIIGIQVENEYGHVGGDNGPNGVAHMEWLYDSLKDIGFEVPYYTATAWGGGIWVNDMLPVFGGYVESPWAQTTAKIAPSKNFLFHAVRDSDDIASDFQFTHRVDGQNVAKHPYTTAELGGGLQVTHHRRPYIDGDDIAQQAIAKFASVANLLVYYMYHGGSNPIGKLSTLQESKAIGYPNDLPIISYDFQARKD